MRWLIFVGVLLTLLAWLHPVRQAPDLEWLAGSWHDPDHETTRFVCTSAGDRGVTGLLTTDQQVTVLAIDPNGQLLVRDLGPNLDREDPPKEQALLQQGPQELRYRSAALRYLNVRTDSCELQVELNGRSLRLQRD